MTIAVRRAKASDVDWLLGELKAFAEFVDTACNLLEDEDYARTQLAAMIAGHYVIVAEQMDEMSGAMVPVGLLGAYAIPHPFNPKVKLLSETFWWVTPSARGSRAGLMLLNEYTAYGLANADMVTIALEEKSPIKQKSLEKRGFKLIERSFVLEPIRQPETPSEVA